MGLRKTIIATLAVTLTAAGAAAGTWLAPDANAVAGGTPARQPYPWIANLSMAGVPDAESHVCGASMITDRWAVTAAHCVDFDAEMISDLVVRVGSADRLRGGQVRRVARAVKHPKYSGHGEGAGVTADIALIELSDRVAGQPVQIASATTPGTRTRIAGWGNTCAEPVPACDEFPAGLRELDARVAVPGDCGAMDPATELCTAFPSVGSGACSGDSGGPQFAAAGYGRWQLLGVTSRTGHGETTCGQGPAIYTSVTAYARWITDTISG